MTTIPHPIEREELMAYMDGELAIERASALASHLEDCRECQAVTADFQKVTLTLANWEVEPASVRRLRWPTKNKWISVKPFFEYGAVAAAMFLFAVLGVRLIGGNANTIFPQPYLRPPAANTQAQGKQIERLEQYAKLQRPPAAVFKSVPESPEHDALVAKVLTPADSGSAKGPMIVRTAELAVTVQGFEKARATAEQILKRYRGYIDNLQVTAPAGNPRTLAAKLRIPSDQLDAALAELKRLGRVDTEAQTGEEVTAQYVDLQARLANSRNTEQRLTDVLRERTGKLSDVLEVETEIARVRGEIESMEAERKTMEIGRASCRERVCVPV